MKVLFLFNGMSHYFNLITSQINKQPGVEILYISPKGMTGAIGEGVFQTKSGADFQHFELEEKKNAELGYLYFEGLKDFLIVHKPDIILDSGTYLSCLMHDVGIGKIIRDQNIKVILKTIPFNVKKLNDLVNEFENKLRDIYPQFASLPSLVRRLVKLLKIDTIYKKLFLDKKLTTKFIRQFDDVKRRYNFPDAHVNYIEEAYDIYGSYGVPRKKIFITYNSPDTDLYFSIKDKIEKEDLILPHNKFRIIHLSRLVAWKKVDMLITAVADLRISYPGIELLIVGEGPERENLIKLSCTLGVQGQVKFLGGVYEPAMLGKYLMASSIYILAGMGGLSINDAMIFGLPVICSVCDGTEKYLVKEGYNGCYFESGDQKDLERKIKYLFDNPEVRDQMGRNSVRIIKERINIHTVVQGYMNAFNYVLHDAKSISK